MVELTAMSVNGEIGPGINHGPNNESVTSLLVHDCASEALACVELVRVEQASPYAADGVLLLLAEATNSPDVANLIRRNDLRLASLAGIARRTDDTSLGQAVATEAADQFGKADTSALLRVAGEMNEPASLLAAVADQAARKRVACKFATHFEDLGMIAAIEDIGQREAVLLDIIQRTDHDIGPFLALLSHEQQQHAIAQRANMKEDVSLAAAVTDKLDRAQILLGIARKCAVQIGTEVTEVIELIAQSGDDDPFTKALCIEEYMKLSGSDSAAGMLLATARKITDSADRAPFLGVVFAKTKDPDVARELEQILDAGGDCLPQYSKDGACAGLAIGLCDISYARKIMNSTLRYDTAKAVIIQKGDSQFARATAADLMEPGLLHDFAVAHSNIALALEMTDSSDNTERTHGIHAVLAIACKNQNVQPILQIRDRVLCDNLIIDYLVQNDNLELAETIPDMNFRSKVLSGIAKKRNDLGLAMRLNDQDAVIYIEQTLMASGETKLPIDDVELITDHRQRINAYYPHLADGQANIKDKILACIRQLPDEQQSFSLSTLAERTCDPSIAYEALYKIQGAIYSISAVEVVARMIAVTQGRLLQSRL